MLRQVSRFSLWLYKNRCCYFDRAGPGGKRWSESAGERRREGASVSRVNKVRTARTRVMHEGEHHREKGQKGHK